MIQAVSNTPVLLRESSVSSVKIPNPVVKLHADVAVRSHALDKKGMEIVGKRNTYYNQRAKAVINNAARTNGKVARILDVEA